LRRRRARAMVRPSSGDGSFLDMVGALQ
jgi:hypothetical protein